MINLLIADALKPDCGHVTVDMDQIEVGHRRVSHRLPRHTRLKLFNGTRPGVRVNGQDFVRLELVALAAEATAKAGFFGETDKLLQQRIVCLDLALLVSLKSDGLQLLGSHCHR